MKKVLGLDISTSCIGVTIISFDSTKNITIDLLDHIKLTSSKIKTFWEKVDCVNAYIDNTTATFQSLSYIYVEEPVLGFRPGQSSASTIATLLKFNGLVSYAFRNKFKIDPNYITPSSARKLCGIKLLRPSLCGKNQKDQVFDFMRSSDLQHVTWQVKKSGMPVDWAKDVTDSYVVAKAGALLNM